MARRSSSAGMPSVCTVVNIFGCIMLFYAHIIFRPLLFKPCEQEEVHTEDICPFYFTPQRMGIVARMLWHTLDNFEEEVFLHLAWKRKTGDKAWRTVAPAEHQHHFGSCSLTCILLTRPHILLTMVNTYCARYSSAIHFPHTRNNALAVSSVSCLRRVSFSRTHHHISSSIWEG